MFAKLAPVFALCLIAAVACKKQEAKTEPAPSGGTEQPATPGGDAGGGGTMANNAAMCGGVGAVKCAGANEYCHMDEGKCTTADASGSCMAKPEVCTDMSAPVCGCDGKDYDSACKASMAGVSVKSQGKCPSP